MYRSVNSGSLAGQGLSSFWNSANSGQTGLNGMLNNVKLKSMAKKQNSSTAQNNSANAASLLNAAKGQYDPKTGTWVTSGNQLEVYQNLIDRQGYNQTIQKALAGKGIKLSPKEKLTLSIDHDGKVTVSGVSNVQKKAQIEEAINGAKQDLGSGLLVHMEKIKAMNGKQNPLELQKWLVSGFLKDYAGQDLSELKLAGGKITGANEKLQKILNSDAKDLGKDAAFFQGAIADLKSVLAYGPEKIADIKPSIDFQNGSLIDKNVKYGFGPEQLKSWYGKAMSGNARWDAKA